MRDRRDYKEGGSKQPPIAILTNPTATIPPIPAKSYCKAAQSCDQSQIQMPATSSVLQRKKELLADSRRIVGLSPITPEDLARLQQQHNISREAAMVSCFK